MPTGHLGMTWHPRAVSVLILLSISQLWKPEMRNLEANNWITIVVNCTFIITEHAGRKSYPYYDVFLLVGCKFFMAESMLWRHYSICQGHLLLFSSLEHCPLGKLAFINKEKKWKISREPMTTVISNLNLFLFGILLSSNWEMMCMYFLLVTQDVKENYKQHEQMHWTKIPKILAWAQESGSEVLRTRNTFLTLACQRAYDWILVMFKNPFGYLSP